MSLCLRTRFSRGSDFGAYDTLRATVAHTNAASRRGSFCEIFVFSHLVERNPQSLVFKFTLSANPFHFVVHGQTEQTFGSYSRITNHRL